MVEGLTSLGLRREALRLGVFGPWEASGSGVSAERRGEREEPHPVICLVFCSIFLLIKDSQRKKTNSLSLSLSVCVERLSRLSHCFKGDRPLVRACVEMKGKEQEFFLERKLEISNS